MNYTEAFALVIPALELWRRRTPPYSQDEIVTCPACKGRMRFVQTAYNISETRTKVAASCQTAFCVNYSE